MRRLGSHIVQPSLSSVLATNPNSYVSSLQEYRQGNLDSYTETFSKAATALVGHVYTLTKAFGQLQQHWLKYLAPRGRVRSYKRPWPYCPLLPLLTQIV